MINQVISETNIMTNDFTVESKIEEHTVFFFLDEMDRIPLQ